MGTEQETFSVGTFVFLVPPRSEMCRPVLLSTRPLSVGAYILSDGTYDRRRFGSRNPLRGGYAPPYRQREKRDAARRVAGGLHSQFAVNKVVMDTSLIGMIGTFSRLTTTQTSGEWHT